MSHEEKFIAEKRAHAIFVGRHPEGDPKNRIIIRPVGNIDPTKDIVFDVLIRENRLVLQYPLYFKLEKMFLILQFIRDNEKPIIEIGNTLWKF